jgi:hypothetical protein
MMSEKGGPTYWEDCFPEHVQFAFAYEDALLWAASHITESTARANKCVIEIKRVAPNQHRKTKQKLEAAVDADGGEWNTGEFNFVARLWEGVKQGAPVAFMTFRIAIEERTRSGRIASLVFEPDLAYVLEIKRKRGLGKMLAAAFEPWLAQCKVYGPRVKRGGVSILFFAEYHSEGGGDIGDILFAHFRFIQEGKKDCPSRVLGWDIRELDYDAGF